MSKLSNKKLAKVVGFNGILVVFVAYLWSQDIEFPLFEFDTLLLTLGVAMISVICAIGQADAPLDETSDIELGSMLNMIFAVLLGGLSILILLTSVSSTFVSNIASSPLIQAPAELVKVEVPAYPAEIESTLGADDYGFMVIKGKVHVVSRQNFYELKKDHITIAPLDDLRSVKTIKLPKVKPFIGNRDKGRKEWVELDDELVPHKIIALMQFGGVISSYRVVNLESGEVSKITELPSWVDNRLGFKSGYGDAPYLDKDGVLYTDFWGDRKVFNHRDGEYYSLPLSVTTETRTVDRVTLKEKTLYTEAILVLDGESMSLSADVYPILYNIKPGDRLEFAKDYAGEITSITLVK